MLFVEQHVPFLCATSSNQHSYFKLFMQFIEQNQQQTSVIKQGKDIVSKFSSKGSSLYAKCNDNQWLKSDIQGRNIMIA